MRDSNVKDFLAATVFSGTLILAIVLFYWYKRRRRQSEWRRLWKPPD